ncbi:ras protein [Mycena olivaceomarginata]|nr:ras protein [Mycena olivaceomarginata]
MDQWTVAVLGDGGVRKTALAVRTYDPTIEDSYRKQFVVDNRMCFVQVLDTAGQEEYATLRDQWGQAFAPVYSIASRSTFDRLEVLRQSVSRVKREHSILVLVGNQCDRVNDRDFGCEFIETSAKTSQNVEGVFTTLVRALRQTGNSPGAAPNENRKCIIL